MESSTHDPAFHYFSQLPAELRIAIWRECLPHRVVEIDYAMGNYTNAYPVPLPCNLLHTSNVNRQPPMISRVCRESRHVAFETGYQLVKESPPPEARWARWNSSLLITKSWIDPTRDTIHLNWSPCYKDGWLIWGEGSALDYLAWSSRRAHGGSFMFDYLDNTVDGYVDMEGKIGSIQRLRQGSVVIKIVVVHTTFDAAAKTGLFGLLGDACIQLVDVRDEARLNAFYDFAEKCESKAKGFVRRPQDFRRQSPESIQKTLRDKLAGTFQSQAGGNLPELSPVIMFRFCSLWCNHVLPLPRRTFRGW